MFCCYVVVAGVMWGTPLSVSMGLNVPLYTSVTSVCVCVVFDHSFVFLHRVFFSYEGVG